MSAPGGLWSEWYDLQGSPGGHWLWGSAAVAARWRGLLTMPPVLLRPPAPWSRHLLGDVGRGWAPSVEHQNPTVSVGWAVVALGRNEVATPRALRPLPSAVGIATAFISVVRRI